MAYLSKRRVFAVLVLAGLIVLGWNSRQELRAASSEYNFFNPSPAGDAGGLAVPASCDSRTTHSGGDGNPADWNGVDNPCSNNCGATGKRDCSGTCMSGGSPVVDEPIGAPCNCGGTTQCGGTCSQAAPCQEVYCTGACNTNCCDMRWYNDSCIGACPSGTSACVGGNSCGSPYNTCCPVTCSGGGTLCSGQEYWEYRNCTGDPGAGWLYNSTTGYYHHQINAYDLVNCPPNAACGPAATNYASSASSFAGSLCNNGLVSPSNPSFPPQGGRTDWTCTGAGGPASCTATRDSGGEICIGGSIFFPGVGASIGVRTGSLSTISAGGSTTIRASINGGTFPEYWIFKNPTQTSPVDPTINQGSGYSLYTNTLESLGYGTLVSGPTSFNKNGATYDFSTGNLNTTTTYRVVAFDSYALGNDCNRDIHPALAWDDVQVTVLTPPVCGQANGHTFPSAAGAYTTTYDQCDSGTPSSTAFPAIGGSVSWTCSGSPASGTCTASRKFAPPTVSCNCTGSAGTDANCTWSGGGAYFWPRFDTDPDSDPALWQPSSEPTTSTTKSLSSSNGLTAGNPFMFWVHTNGSTAWNSTVSDAGIDRFTCSASCTPFPSACGSANGQTLASAPSGSALCGNNNSASSVSGSGPWNWTCSGTCGAAPTPCSASKQVTAPLPPTINYSCNTDGTSVTLTYSSSGATLYYPRLATNPGGPPSGYTVNSPGTSLTSMAVSISPDTQYTYWVHAGGTVWCPAANCDISDSTNRTFTCPSASRPACNTTPTGTPPSSNPATNLCNRGTPSAVIANASTYDWTCSLNSYVDNCSVSRTFSCQGSLVGNASPWDAEESTGLSANGTWTYANPDSPTKCQFQCNSGYAWNSGPQTCTLTPFSCQQSIPLNASSWGASETTGLGNNTTNWTYSSSNTAALCQFYCDSGYTWNSSSLTCTSTMVYACQGSIPANASSYGLGETPSDNTTSWVYSASPNSNVKCEYRCNPSYTWDGVSSCIAGYSCQGTRPPNTSFYGVSETTGLTNNTTSWTYSTSNTAAFCEYYCRVGATWDSLTQSCNYSCTGSRPLHTTPYTDDEKPNNDSTSWVYASSNSPAKCQFYCDSGYTWNSGSQTCTSTVYTCQQSIPLNASSWGASETTGLGNNTTNWTYSSSNTAALCQFYCDSGYTWSGSACTSSASCIDLRPANSQWWDAEENQSVPPSTTSVYSVSDTGAKCEFRCLIGYTWGGGTCNPPAVPDIVPIIDSAPTTVLTGTSYSFVAHPRNVGGVATPRGFQDALYKSYTGGPPWTLLQTFSQSSLGSGANGASDQHSFAVTEGAGATFVLIMYCVNSNSGTSGAELSNTEINNNCTTINVTVTSGVPPTGGICGSADRLTYAYGSSSYAPYSQCSSGSSNNTNFPAAGSSQGWTCLHVNGNSGPCSASQLAGGGGGGGSYPDLIASPVRMDGTPISVSGSAAAGSTHTFSTIITNQGTTASGAFFNRISFRNQGGSVTNAYRVPPFSRVSSLAASASAFPSFTLQLTSPPYQSGTTWTVWACADSQSEVDESAAPNGESNNCSLGYTLTVTGGCSAAAPANSAFHSGDEVNPPAGETVPQYAASNTARMCEFRCNPTYFWVGGACVLGPACNVTTMSTSTSTPPSSTPATNLCTRGTPSAVTTNALSYSWTCSQAGFLDDTCSATRIIANTPPTAPLITGNNGAINTLLPFGFTSTDPDSDTLHYGIDWDNNFTVDEWSPTTGYVNSGPPGSTIQKSWPTAGPVSFQVLAQDSKGANSPWTVGNYTIIDNRDLTICRNSCASGFRRDGSGETLTSGDVVTYVACFNASTDCTGNDATDRVNATWSDNNTPSNAVNRSGSNPSTTQAITANDPPGRNDTLSETVSATYNGITRNVPVTVSKFCGSIQCDVPPGKQANTCQGERYDGDDSCGTITDGCQGTRSCDFNWKEVAP